MVGASGFEPPTCWSRTRKRNAILFARLALSCVERAHLGQYSAANGVKSDSSTGPIAPSTQLIGGYSKENLQLGRGSSTRRANHLQDLNQGDLDAVHVAAIHAHLFVSYVSAAGKHPVASPQLNLRDRALPIIISERAAGRARKNDRISLLLESPDAIEQSDSFRTADAMLRDHLRPVRKQVERDPTERIEGRDLPTKSSGQ
jgi:hypothetical protein